MSEHGAKKVFSLACRYSYTRLALNYYMYCETFQNMGHKTEQMTVLQQKLTALVGALLDGTLTEEAAAEVRNQIHHQTELVTTYADCFQIYEHVLNRLEGRFLEKAPFTEADELFAKQIMKYITSTKDHMVLNGRIQEIVAQLPVRLTKAKFAGFVQDGLSAYIGSDKSSLESVFYMLRTTSMMDMPKAMKSEYEGLYEMLEKFQKADFKKMEKEEYQALSGILSSAVEYIQAVISDYQLMQDIVNDLYLLALTQKEGFMEAEEQQVVLHILSVLHEKMEEAREAEDALDMAPILDSLFDSMTQLEGKQEALYERYLKNEGQWTEGLEENLKETGRKVELLLSDSPFVDLDGQENDETADRDYVTEQSALFIKELLEHLSALPKPVSRAVMANILSHLPVFFNSLNEIETYVRGSLESCTDMYEKGTCMEIIRSIMESENALV
ncbi:MAG: hypothetical protein Q4E24_00285 [bacterium]|nr:hypothetical protein [bacterium]